MPYLDSLGVGYDICSKLLSRGDLTLWSEMNKVKYIGSSTITIEILTFSAPGPLCEGTSENLRVLLQGNAEFEAYTGGIPAVVLRKSELDTVLCTLGCTAVDLLAEAPQQQNTLDRAAAVIADGSQLNSSSILTHEERSNRLARLMKIEEDKQHTVNRLAGIIAQLTKDEKELQAKIKRLHMDERELQERLQHLVERVAENQQLLDQACLDRQETQERFRSERELFEMD